MAPDIDVHRVLGALVDAALAGTTRRPLVIGLCGAQGSGKSTVAARLTQDLNADGISTATLSLDDLYLGRAERATLAARVHPLLRTRGVPGTHDVGLGLAVFEALDRGAAVRLPRFDKARDDRHEEASWTAVAPGLKVLLFEGWCVGAKPQTTATLVEPVNALERDEDSGQHWRRYVNAALGGAYQQLFARLDRLVLLAAPDFGSVRAWRREQEESLRQRGPGPGVMSDADLHRFVQHYERLTQHILSEMPNRADLTVELTANRSVRNVLAAAQPAPVA